MARNGDDVNVKKPEWRAPKLDALGNLRDFVRTGHAFGKSGGPSDGSSTPGGESMIH